MLPVKNLKQEKKAGNTTLNMIVYGDSGVGKTTLASSSAELGKVLYIDAESGAKFIQEKYSDKIDLLTLDNPSVLNEVLKTENVKEYETIVLDSITEIMKKMVDMVKGNKERPTLQDWGTVISGMETYFRKFRDLGKNIILVALTAEKDDDGVILKRPSLSGKNLPADVIGFMDVCMYLENTSTGRVGHVQPSQKFYAKDRTSKLPPKIEQDQLLVKKILEMVTVAPEPITKEQLKEIQDGIVVMDMNEEAVSKMADYGGAFTIEELSSVGAEKVIKAMKIKLQTFKPKNEPVSNDKTETEQSTVKDEKNATEPTVEPVADDEIVNID